MRNSDFLEYLMLQQLGGGAASAQLWLQVAMLVCLFLAAVLRPEVVRSRPLFRLACVLFALSLLVSPTMNYLASYLFRSSSPGPGYGGGMDGDMALLMSFPSVISSVLFGLSLICGLCSLGLPGAAAAAKSPQSLSALAAPSGAAAPDETYKPRPTAPHPLDEPD